MNLELLSACTDHYEPTFAARLDPLIPDYPSTIEATIPPSTFDYNPDERDEVGSTCARFMPGTNAFGGRYLAVGRGDGTVAIVEMETRLPLMQLRGHVKHVVDVRWSRCGRYLLSASRDWNAIIWDLSTGDRRETVRFDAPLTSAVLHPRNRCVRPTRGAHARSKILVVTIQNQIGRAHV